MYTDIDHALKRAKERGFARDKDDEYLLELLNLSRGIHVQTQEIVYRPFWVAAKYLEQSRRDQTLEAADDVKFTNQVTPIKSLLGMQELLDTDLNIPIAYQINPKIPDAAQLKAAYDHALLFLKRYQPRGML